MKIGRASPSLHGVDYAIPEGVEHFSVHMAPLNALNPQIGGLLEGRSGRDMAGFCASLRNPSVLRVLTRTILNPSAGNGSISNSAKAEQPCTCFRTMLGHGAISCQRIQPKWRLDKVKSVRTIMDYQSARDCRLRYV